MFLTSWCVRDGVVIVNDAVLTNDTNIDIRGNEINDSFGLKTMQDLLFRNHTLTKILCHGNDVFVGAGWSTVIQSMQHHNFALLQVYEGMYIWYDCICSYYVML